MEPFVLISAAPFERNDAVAALKKRAEVLSLDCGIGSLAAAKAAAALADQCRQRHAVFIGTCGSFAEFTAPYLITTTKVIWQPTGERLGLAYGLPQTTPALALAAPRAWCRSLPLRTVVCGPSISLEPRLDSPDAAACVENLELYSCAGEIQAASRSFTVLLCVTNAVGASAHSQWRQHAAAAAALTAEFLDAKMLNEE